MNLPKIKKGIYAELPKITQTVKQGAIEKPVGLRTSFISKKLNRSLCRGKYESKFSVADVQKINEGMWAVGEQLVNVQIAFSENHDEVRLAIKEALSPLFFKEFMMRVLDMTEPQVRFLMYSTKLSYRRGHFTPELVDKLTLAAREVGVRLLSTELYLDE